MPSGVPIRLVQENGNLIELEAQSMTLTTSRKVGGSPLPFTGSRRIGIDLNVNSAMINIQGVIPDDREGTTSIAHSATIDYGNTMAGNQFNTALNLVRLTSQRIEMQWYGTPNRSTTNKRIPFINVTARTDGESTTATTTYDANAGAGSTPTILVNTGNATAAELATATAAYVNGELSSTHTAITQSAVDWNGDTANNIVKITYVTNGNDTTVRKRTPKWTLTGYFVQPSTTKFAGGTSGGKKSAGDKAMDLYGVINNSKRRGIVSDILTRNSREDEVKDYIIAIQIPYNSTVQAASGELYVARNFFMPTGYYTGLQKTSSGNTKPASVAFKLDDRTSETSGIQGSVQKFDIMYDAGETVYTFNLIFAPIDNLILS